MQSRWLTGIAILALGTPLPGHASLRLIRLLPPAAETAADTTEAPKTAHAQTPEQDEEIDELNEARLAHAKELLGKYYQHSIVRSGERIDEVEDFIYDWTKRSLKGKWHGRAHKVAQTILEESKKHDFDPVFLMAVIKTESAFNPLAKGSQGEIGLMQLMPKTAKWIARKFDLKFKGPATLRDPIQNIRLGAAYLSYLREKFDFHGRLYLAAYNMGTTKVNRNLENHKWPKEYPSRVMQKYIKYYRDIARNLSSDSDTKTE